MSGRAGRRGLDSTGMVIIACSGDEAPEVRQMNGKSDQRKEVTKEFLYLGVRSIDDDSGSPNQTRIAVPFDIQYDFEPAASRGAQSRRNDQAQLF